MGWLTVNGIELKKIVAVSGEPSDGRRDIGSVTEASDGSLVITRTARKGDFKFTTKPLTSARAWAWEGLLAGLGEVWPFDVSLYGSKGTAPAVPETPPDVVLQSGVTKFGAQALKINDPYSWSTDPFLGAVYTGAVWCRVDAGAFKHYVIRSDGAKFVDGVRDDGASMPLLYSSGGIVLTFTGAGTTYYYDDLVGCPFLWPDDWPAQVAGSSLAFGPAPFVTAAGDLVLEAASRRMLCTEFSSKIIIAGLEGELRRDARVLSFELKGA